VENTELRGEYKEKAGIQRKGEYTERRLEYRGWQYRREGENTERMGKTEGR
jgi:hypothetical protein